MEVNEYITLYANETADIIQSLEGGLMELEAGSDTSAIDELFRHAHNLKGMSGTMGFDSVVEASHSLENILDGLRQGRIVISKEKTDSLLKVVDLLREMIRGVVDDGECEETSNLLGRIVNIMSIGFEEEYKGDPSCEEDDASSESGGEIRDSSPAGAGPDAPERVSENKETGREPEEERGESEQRESSCSSPGGGAGSSKNAAYYSRITSTRVELKRLDNLMDMVGELIISRIRLSNIAESVKSKQLSEELAASGRLVSEIQREVVEARLVPAGHVFQRFKRLVRDVSTELDKSVRFKIVGADIGLDRTVLETMIDPLIHLIRNSIDHGIETPEKRKEAGKDKTGTIILQARRERNFVIIELEDDGKGIDKAEVARRTVWNKGGPPSELSDEELCRILTSPGFSTKESAGRYSGRGVGMNAVKDAVDSLGGSLSLKNNEGKGTSVRLHLPINLSIIKALLFEAGTQIHALPIEYIKETTRVEQKSFKTAGGSEIFITQEGPIPIIRPRRIFNLNDEIRADRYYKVIVLETETGLGGLLVDRILGQQDVVIKTLPGIIRGMEGISGATVLGSGRVAFIWDPRYLLKERQNNESDQETVVSEN